MEDTKLQRIADELRIKRRKILQDFFREEVERLQKAGVPTHEITRILHLVYN